MLAREHGVRVDGLDLSVANVALARGAADRAGPTVDAARVAFQ
jgi:hypothetical protein